MNNNYLRDEYIGKSAKIKKGKKEYAGTIIDETKNTFRILQDNKIRTILKNNSIIDIDNKKINGDKITKRPEDRIKL